VPVRVGAGDDVRRVAGEDDVPAVRRDRSAVAAAVHPDSVAADADPKRLVRSPITDEDVGAMVVVRRDQIARVRVEEHESPIRGDCDDRAALVAFCAL
jgi:hypothetical protein